MRNFIFLFSCIVLISLVGAQNPPYFSDDVGVIYVKERNSISDLRLINKNYFEIKGNSCHIKYPLEVQGTFFVNDSSCSVIYLYPNSYIKIVGTIYFENVKISSYEPNNLSEIIISKDNYNKKRPYIVFDNGRYFYSKNSEFSNLGYYNEDGKGSTWGLAFYNVPGSDLNPSFEIIDSKIHDNYFGVYTFNVEYGRIIDSEIYDNLEYGLDFHDYSDNFRVYRNEIYRNGNHALIFSKFCKENEIIGNVIRDNNVTAFVKGDDKDYGTHGIVLHHFSDENLIKDNILKNNIGGINLADSSYNVIYNNTIISDNEDGIYISNSHNNQINSNKVLNATRYGFYSYYSYNNSYFDNFFDNGLYVKTKNNGSEFSFFIDEFDYNESSINDRIKLESTNNNSLEFIGIEDKALLGKIFFVIGIILVVFFIMVIEIFVIIFRRRSGHANKSK